MMILLVAFPVFVIMMQNITFQGLLEPYTYITSNPGKEIRGEMIEAFNKWLNVPVQSLRVIARVISMLHNASLL